MRDDEQIKRTRNVGGSVIKKRKRRSEDDDESINPPRWSRDLGHSDVPPHRRSIVFVYRVSRKEIEHGRGRLQLLPRVRTPWRRRNSYVVVP